MSRGYIRFWGVRGSNPTPDKDKMEFGGETSCIEVKTSDNELIVLDMGSGIRNLGNEILNDPSYPKNIHIFLSHFHWDHIMGFLLFTPFYDASFTFNLGLIAGSLILDGRTGYMASLTQFTHGGEPLAIPLTGLIKTTKGR